MISPDEAKKLPSIYSNIDVICKQIDESIIENHGMFNYDFAIISGELSVSLRNQIAQMYVDAGWDYVYHSTSSENHERPGLTEFCFSMKQLHGDSRFDFVHHVVRRETNNGD